MQREYPIKIPEKNPIVAEINRKVITLVESVLSKNEPVAIAAAKWLDEIMLSQTEKSREIFRGSDAADTIRRTVISSIYGERITDAQDYLRASMLMMVENTFLFDKIGIIKLGDGKACGCPEKFSLDLLRTSAEQKSELISIMRAAQIPDSLFIGNPSIIYRPENLILGIPAIRAIAKRQGIRLKFVDSMKMDKKSPSSNIPFQTFRHILWSGDIAKVEAFVRKHGLKPNNSDMAALSKAMSVKHVKSTIESDEEVNKRLAASVRPKAEELTAMLLKRDWDAASRAGEELDTLFESTKTRKYAFVSVPESMEIKIGIIHSVIANLQDMDPYLSFSAKKLAESLRVLYDYGFIRLRSDPKEMPEPKSIPWPVLFSDPVELRELLEYLEKNLSISREILLANPSMISKPRNLISTLKFVEWKTKELGMKPKLLDVSKNVRLRLLHGRINIYALKGLSSPQDKSELISYLNRFGLRTNKEEFEAFVSRLSVGRNGSLIRNNNVDVQNE